MREDGDAPRIRRPRRRGHIAEHRIAPVGEVRASGYGWGFPCDRHGAILRD
jgi:hypothetical protein